MRTAFSVGFEIAFEPSKLQKDAESPREGHFVFFCAKLWYAPNPVSKEIRRYWPFGPLISRDRSGNTLVAWYHELTPSGPKKERPYRNEGGSAREGVLHLIRVSSLDRATRVMARDWIANRTSQLGKRSCLSTMRELVHCKNK